MHSKAPYWSCFLHEIQIKKKIKVTSFARKMMKNSIIFHASLNHFNLFWVSQLEFRVSVWKEFVSIFRRSTSDGVQGKRYQFFAKKMLNFCCTFLMLIPPILLSKSYFCLMSQQRSNKAHLLKHSLH